VCNESGVSKEFTTLHPNGDTREVFAMTPAGTYARGSYRELADALTSNPDLRRDDVWFEIDEDRGGEDRRHLCAGQRIDPLAIRAAVAFEDVQTASTEFGIGYHEIKRALRVAAELVDAGHLAVADDLIRSMCGKGLTAADMGANLTHEQFRKLQAYSKDSKTSEGSKPAPKKRGGSPRWSRTESSQLVVAKKHPNPAAARRWAVECMNHDGEWLSLGDYSCREHASQVVERATVLPDVAEVRMVEPDAPLRIDESRLGVPATGVFVRAETGPSGKVGSVDIAHLDHSSLRRWLEAAEGRAADVVLILLGHGGQ
jgi:hypothetical protein